MVRHVEEWLHGTRAPYARFKAGIMADWEVHGPGEPMGSEQKVCPLDTGPTQPQVRREAEEKALSASSY